MTTVSSSRALKGLIFFQNWILPVALTVSAGFISPFWLVSAFIIAGQYHFTMMYIYQFRAGRMKQTQYLIMVLLFLLAAFWYFGTIGLFVPILIATTFFFALHFAVDEFYLRGEYFSISRAITTAGFVLLYTALSILVFWPQYLLGTEIILGIVLLIAMVRLVVPAFRPSPTERFLWFVEVLACIATFIFHVPGQVLSLIIFLHYFNWCVAYGRKVHGTSREKQYWIDTGITFVASFVGFFGYAFGKVQILRFIFEPIYYYTWTLAHFVFASRWIGGTKTPMNL